MDLAKYTINDKEAALKTAAKLVAVYGDKALPLYKMLKLEVEKAKSREDSLEEALRLAGSA